MSRTPRIFVDRELAQGLDLIPEDQALKHLTRVLRLHPGASVQIFDGRGREHAAILLNGDTGPFLRVAEQIDVPPESPLRICLLQGISRGERMDLVVQKATELGVTAIRPLETQRSVVRLEQRRARRRLEHWQGIIVAACEQCGRATLPDLHPPANLETALDTLPPDATRWMLDARGDGPSPAVTTGEGGVVLLVGPEGGLTEPEKARALSRGFTPLRLGPRIMRTETAAIAAIAVAQALWGDLSASP